MSKILTKFLLVIVIYPGITYGNEPESQDTCESVRSYRCEIILKNMYLFGISKGFGEILLSGDFRNIYLGARAVVDALDDMKNGLESMDVPEEMGEPYKVFLESIKAYRQSADYIRIAVGILLGYYDGTGIEVQEIIDQSENYVDIANKYLGMSIVMHGELFGVDRQSPDECKKYAGDILNQDRTYNQKSEGNVKRKDGSMYIY